MAARGDGRLTADGPFGHLARGRHPDYVDEQVEMALARLLWGDDLYQKARPDWPLLDP